MVLVEEADDVVVASRHEKLLLAAVLGVAAATRTVIGRASAVVAVAATAQLPSFSPLTADTSADVCIVGAGYAGLSSLSLAEIAETEATSKPVAEPKAGKPAKEPIRWRWPSLVTVPPTSEPSTRR